MTSRETYEEFYGAYRTGRLQELLAERSILLGSAVCNIDNGSNAIRIVPLPYTEPDADSIERMRLTATSIERAKAIAYLAGIPAVQSAVAPLVAEMERIAEKALGRAPAAMPELPKGATIHDNGALIRAMRFC